MVSNMRVQGRIILVVVCLLLWGGPGVALGQTPGSITMQWERTTLEQALSALQQVAPFEVDIPDNLRSYPLEGVFLRASSVEEGVVELLSGTRINYAAQYSQGRLRRLVIVGLEPPAMAAATREEKKQDREEVAEERTGTPSPPVAAVEKRHEGEETKSDEQSSGQSPVGFAGSGSGGAASGGGAMGKPEGATGDGTASSSDAAEHVRAMERNLTRGGQSSLPPAEVQRRVDEWRRMWLGQTSNPR